MPFILSFVASRALAACTGKLRIAGNGDRRLGSLLRPPSRPGRGRVNPRYPPVPSVLRTMARRPSSACVGMFLAADHGCAAAGATVPGQLLLSLPET